jgi:hypothetical protein
MVCLVVMKMAVFWVVAPCSLVEVYQRFRGTCCLHHQGDEVLTCILSVKHSCVLECAVLGSAKVASWKNNLLSTLDIHTHASLPVCFFLVKEVENIHFTQL